MQAAKEGLRQIALFTARNWVHEAIAEPELFKIQAALLCSQSIYVRQRCCKHEKSKSKPKRVVDVK